MGEVRYWAVIGSVFLALGCTKNIKTYTISDSVIYSPQDLAQAEFITDLHLVKFADGAWTDEVINEHVREAARVYLQCGLRFANVTVSESPLNSTGLSRWDGRSQRGYLTVGQAAAIGLPHPLVLLIDGFSDDEGSPFAVAPYKIGIGDPPPEELLNTVIFPSYVNSDEYRREREPSPYSTLAHELLHIFTLDGQHNNDEDPNLLTIWRRRSNRITEEQCREVRASTLVRRTAISVTRLKIGADSGL